MKLVQVSDKKTNDAFFSVTRLIYAQDKNYIPHIRQGANANAGFCLVKKVRPLAAWLHL